MELPPGTTLDGGPPGLLRRPVQGRLLRRVRRPGAPRPRPRHGPPPYTDRRALLAALLQDVGPPIQATPATDSRTLALQWYDVLQAQGVEGIGKPQGLPERGRQLRIAANNG